MYGSNKKVVTDKLKVVREDATDTSKNLEKVVVTNKN